jgi:hypothetical protein
MKKNLSVFVLLLSFFLSTSIFAQKTEEIKVWGNCGMCKKTIETAALKAGAKTASWSEETKMLTVAYKPKKTDAKAIQESVAASGYDTQDVTAPNEVYSKLHGCCQYDRKPTQEVAKNDIKKECCGMENCDHKMDCCKEEKCEKDKSCCKDGKCEKGKSCCTK